MSSDSNVALIEEFYTAFGRRDADTMAACYHPDAVFSDPVFELRGEEIGKMWKMLTERGKDLKVVYSGVSAEGDGGQAHWDADYTFSATGRLVHNQIDAKFRFADGKIIEHRDTFDFWKWTRMALGTPGILLGWSGFLQNKVRTTARASLEAYSAASR